MTSTMCRLGSLVTGWLLGADDAVADDAPRPDIIVILSDDMGYSDVGCFGGEIDTPNLDRLAANGLRYTRFYNTGRCVPTRGSLLTGLYAHQAGLGGMASDRGQPGYTGDLASWPMQRGFDRFYGTIIGAGSFYDPWTLTRGNKAITPDNDPDYQPETFYYTHAILPMEGRSMIPGFARDGEGDGRLLIWEHMGNAAIRRGDWKLVRLSPRSPWELYDMAKDRSEMNNLVGKHPELAAELAALWEKHAHRTLIFPLPETRR